MAMTMQGEVQLGASREAVWAKLNDPRCSIDQQEIAARDAPVALAGHPIMHDGAVRPGA